MSEFTPVATEKRMIWLLGISFLLILSGWIAYWDLPNHNFLNYDDQLFVTDNSYVQQGITSKGLAWAFTSTKYNWHPLTWISHMADYQVYGLDPVGHHNTNLILHLLNTVLLFYFFLQATGDLGRSAFVAALFALHPLHVESVAWVAERRDMLSGLFWMLTLIAYGRYAKVKTYGMSYVLVMGFFLCGLMSKPMMVTLPFVLLLLDYWPLKRWGTDSWRLLFLEKCPLFFLAGVGSAIAFISQHQGNAVVSLEKMSLALRLSHVPLAYVEYLAKAFFPRGLAILYPYPAVLPLWEVVGAIFILGMLSVGFWRARASAPYLIVGWLWFLGTLVPVIGFVQIGSQAIADRYTYIPLIGIFLMISWGAEQCFRYWYFSKTSNVLLAGMVVVVLICCTQYQMKFWRNTFTLFDHALAVTQNNSLAHRVLAITFAQQGNISEAMYHYQQEIAMHPKALQPRLQMAHLLAKQGKTAEAMQSYQEVLSLRPDYGPAHNGLGLLLAQQGKTKEALHHYALAVNSGEENAEAHNNWANVLIGEGKIAEAMAQYAQALRINPEMADAYYNIGNALMGQGRDLESIHYYEQAIFFAPKDPDARNNLGNVLSRLGRRQEALECYRLALEICPGHKQAQKNWNDLIARKKAQR